MDLNKFRNWDSDAVLGGLRGDISSQVSIEQEIKNKIEEIVSDARQVMLSSHDENMTKENIEKMNDLIKKAFSLKKDVAQAPSRKVLGSMVLRLLEKLRDMESQLRDR